jgi:hypothetical protein
MDIVTFIEQHFDEEWYLHTYPDVLDALKLKTFTSGKDHYIKFGRKEGRRCHFRLNGQSTSLNLSYMPLKIAFYKQADNLNIRQLNIHDDIDIFFLDGFDTWGVIHE